LADTQRAGTDGAPKSKKKGKKKRKKGKPDSVPPASGRPSLSESGVSEGFFASLPPEEPEPPPDSTAEEVYLTDDQVARKRTMKQVVAVVVGVLGALGAFGLYKNFASSGGPSTTSTITPTATTSAPNTVSSAPSSTGSVAASTDSASTGSESASGSDSGAGGQSGGDLDESGKSVADSDEPLPEVDDPLKKAMSFLNVGSWKKAIPMAKAAIKKDRENADAYMALAWAYESGGKLPLKADVLDECFRKATKGNYKSMCRAKKKKKK